MQVGHLGGQRKFSFRRPILENFVDLFINWINGTQLGASDLYSNLLVETFLHIYINGLEKKGNDHPEVAKWRAREESTMASLGS